MFGLFDDLAGGIGKIIGVATGTVLGISSSVISTTLGITQTMVEEALEAGCETYDDIREFHGLD